MASSLPSVELDDHGFPTIFSRILQDELSVDEDDDDNDDKQTVLYDEAGFPVCFEKAPVGKQRAPTENLLPVTPRASKRKAAAISARKDKAASNSSGGGGGGGDSLGCSKCRYSTRGCGRCRNR